MLSSASFWCSSPSGGLGVNFTWFSSAYDTDDVAYRVFVFVTMTGALILAVGVSRAFDERDFTVATLGYVVMRLALVTQWMRVAGADTPRRVTAHRFALGVSACQAGWIAALLLPGDWWIAAFTVAIKETARARGSGGFRTEERP